MKHRFLIHSLSHTILIVDITKIGLPTKVFPPTGELEMVPAIRFQNWRDAEHYFLGRGAEAQVLEKMSEQLKKVGVCVLTIV